MVEAVLVFAVLILLGMLAVMVKLPLRYSLRILAWPITTDIIVTVVVLVIHMGTMTGLMAATVAGLLCSAVTTAGRWAFGWIEGQRYYVGKIDLTTKILLEMRVP